MSRRNSLEYAEFCTESGTVAEQPLAAGSSISEVNSQEPEFKVRYGYVARRHIHVNP